MDFRRAELVEIKYIEALLRLVYPEKKLTILTDMAFYLMKQNQYFVEMSIKDDMELVIKKTCTGIHAFGLFDGINFAMIKYFKFPEFELPLSLDNINAVHEEIREKYLHALEKVEVDLAFAKLSLKYNDKLLELLE
jgi:hypothetical protein